MSTTTDTATDSGSKDPYIRGTDETVLLDLRELRAQEAAEKAAREAGSGTSSAPAGPDVTGIPGTSDVPDTPSDPNTPGAELERYHGSHRRDAVLYADGGTAIPLDRVREVCHDLRQPVAAILMLASAAEMRPDVPERVRDVLQEIMSQTEEISATVRQFLDDAKQGVDGLGEPVPCNVAGLAEESVERWRATFDGDLAMAAAEEPLHVTVDPVLFKRALGNVLSNGTRAAGDAGRVQVTVRRFETADGERAVIEVDDSGPGFGNIPAGHGLGLAVVRRTMEAAGGAVEFAEGPLGGALVRLVLPVTPIRPLSADDELAKTFHGEISLKDLAAQLAAGDLHRALADLDDDDFDDALDGFATETPAPSGHTLTGGHAFTTSLSAWPEPMAISGTPEQLAIGGPAAQGNPFAARAAEQAALAEKNMPAQAELGGAAEIRSYFGLPAQAGDPVADSGYSGLFAQPSDPAGDSGYFGLPMRPSQAAAEPEPAPEAAADPSPFAAPLQPVVAEPLPAPEAGGDRGFFGLPLQGDIPASQPSAVPAPVPAPRAPHNRLYGAPAEIATAQPPHADIAAHPVPTGVQTAPHTAAAQASAATRPAWPAAPQPPAAAPAPHAPDDLAAPTSAAAPAPSAAPQPSTAPAQPVPAPTYDPTDTQPLHIIPTGQDDTALASIQLPSQANLTHPPRIPASALAPVASVQLSLLPGGAF